MVRDTGKERQREKQKVETEGKNRGDGWQRFRWGNRGRWRAAVQCAYVQYIQTFRMGATDCPEKTVSIITSHPFFAKRKKMLAKSFRRSDNHFAIIAIIVKMQFSAK
jgi:hypothetical protein